MIKVIVGIDWGGTFIKLGIFNTRGKLLSKHQIASQQLTKPNKFFPFLKKFIKNTLSKKGLSLSSLAGVGIGAPGVIDMEKGLIYYLPNIKGWRNYPFKKVFHAHFKAPVMLDNDANVAALAELKRGKARGFQRGILFTLGTGLGSGLILGGKIFHGRASAAEAGHMPISLKGKSCSCGSSGCIETYLGSKYFIKPAIKTFKNKRITPKLLYELALKNNKVAKKIWRQFGFNLGVFSAGLVNLLNLEIIILTGGVSQAYRFLIKDVKKALKARAMYPLYNHVKIERSKLGTDAGIIGAYELVKQNLR